MPRLSHEAVLRAPPEKVFRALTDFEAMPSWLPGLRETEVMNEGPLARGTVVMQRRRAMGRMAAFTLTVLHADPPRELVVDHVRDAQRAGVWTWRLDPAPEGTRLAVTVDFVLPGFVNLLLPFVRRAMRNGLEADVEALRRRVEAG
jgi:uncharacterized protein YndB with AHSA1/START domain